MAEKERLPASETERLLESRAARADFNAFDRIMDRKGEQSPGEEDWKE